MKLKNHITILSAGILFSISSCENRDLNEGEAFKPREIHEQIVFNFDKVIVDGIEYLILEKDNNNPHEGFGFMAFRGNKLMEKQDTVISLLKTINEQQNQILSILTKKPIDEVRHNSMDIFDKFLQDEFHEIQLLEQSRLRGKSITGEVQAE